MKKLKKPLIKASLVIIFTTFGFALLLLYIYTGNFRSFIFPEINSQSPDTQCADEICLKEEVEITGILQKKTEIENKLKTQNPNDLYGQILSEYKHKTLNEQHSVAHIFGQYLYRAKKLDGITVCDGSFSFGCFHGFFNEAILDRGIDITIQLDQKCIERFGEKSSACQHGIGHGLIEFLGPKKLTQALDICGRLNWQKPLMGCSGGVFMGYNLPQTDRDDSGSSTALPFNPENPYRPCTGINDKFKPECYYNLGMYWNQVLDKNPAGMLRLCTEIENPRYRDSCLLGVGVTLAENTYPDKKKIQQNCDLSDVEYTRTICRSGAAWFYFAKPESRPEFQSLCEDLPEVLKHTCLEKYNLHSFI